jgi:hypothetical protein
MTSMRSPVAVLVAVVALAATALSAAPAAAQTDAQRCERALLRATATYWSCVFRARAEIALQPEAPLDLAICQGKIWKRRKALVAKYGPTCPKDLWLGTVQRFVDLGDETVLDRATGLQWQKQRNADGKPDLADPRDADNVYSWTASRGGKAADGTAFTSFLPGLNKPGACFAAHCDWRLPTFAELQTILVSTEPCAQTPCLDPIFGPTATGIYWSGEQSPYHPVRAWYVMFIGGLRTTAAKDSSQHARAVRRYQ